MGSSWGSRRGYEPVGQLPDDAATVFGLKETKKKEARLALRVTYVVFFFALFALIYGALYPRVKDDLEDGGGHGPPMDDDSTDDDDDSSNWNVTNVTYSQNATEAIETMRGADVIHIVLDDVGLNDLWESDDFEASIVSPNILQLAKEGIVLTNYFGQSYCTPARAALLTGKFVHKTGFAAADVRGGVTEIVALNNYSIPLGHTLLPELMKTLGYRTHGIGKWNVGHCDEAYLPWNRGFDTFLGYFSDGIHYTSHLVDSIRSPLSGEGYLIVDFVNEYAIYDMQYYNGDETKTHKWDAALSMGLQGSHTTTLFTNEATERIDAAAKVRLDPSKDKEPLYIWLGYHGMHDNLGAGDFALANDDSFWSQQTALGKVTEKRATFGRGLQLMDAGIGNVLNHLNEFAASTSSQYIILIHSDNGGWPCGEVCVGNNIPYRGTKFFDFDGALRVPSILYSNFFQRNGGNVFYHRLTHHVDWFATLASMAGADTKTLLESDDYDAVDHWPYLVAAAVQDHDYLETLDSTNSVYQPRDTIIFSVDDKSATIRQRQYKLLYERSTANYYEPNEEPDATLCLDPSNQHFLFDLENDPTESSNLYYRHEFADKQNELVSFANAVYDSEFYYIPHPRASTYSPELEAAILASSDSNTTKILVPWGCKAIERS